MRNSTGSSQGVTPPNPTVLASAVANPVQAINQARVALCTAVLPLWARQLATSRHQSEMAVAEMLAAFSDLVPVLSAGRSAAQFSPQVERMFMGLQYQDRISQMMTLLHDDMVRLLAVMAAADTPLASLVSADWLARLESQYAMAEQRQDHQAPGQGTAPPSTPDSQTDFF